jgi:hypothetical protein
MSTSQITINEKKLEVILERVILRVLRKQRSDIPPAKEALWLKEAEEALRSGKRYTNVNKLMADTLR